MNKQIFWQKISKNKPILALAPMAGVTDSAFRQICKSFGADVAYSEMASATALTYQPQKTLEILKFNPIEKPYVVQLFGNVPEHFAIATKTVSEKIKPSGIDINFGCPAPKVFKVGSGCAIMPNKKLAREIISSVCENTSLPVSIKIRAGIGKTSAIDFVENVKDLAFSAIMIHCRTYEGKFSSEPDFSLAEKIKSIVPEKIVLANGGIVTPEKAVAVLEKYSKIDGIGIARGCLGRPFIFENIQRALADKQLKKYDFEKIKSVILKHARLAKKDKGQRGVLEMRKHLAWYAKGFSGASELRQKLITVQTIQDISKILNEKTE